MFFKLMSGGELKNGHQGSEGGNDAEDHRVRPKILSQKDYRCSQNDLKADRIVKIKPMEVENTPGIGNRE